MDLDRVPLWPRAGHVSTQQLWSYYAQYLYLPRLRDRSVLVGAIEQGVASTTLGAGRRFAYADAFDEEKERYLGLAARAARDGARSTRRACVVKPEVARQQLDEEAAPRPDRQLRRPDGDEGELPPRSAST